MGCENDQRAAHGLAARRFGAHGLPEAHGFAPRRAGAQGFPAAHGLPPRRTGAQGFPAAQGFAPRRAGAHGFPAAHGFALRRAGAQGLPAAHGLPPRRAGAQGLPGAQGFVLRRAGAHGLPCALVTGAVTAVATATTTAGATRRTILGNFMGISFQMSGKAGVTMGPDRCAPRQRASSASAVSAPPSLRSTREPSQKITAASNAKRASNTGSDIPRSSGNRSVWIAPRMTHDPKVS